MPQASHDQFLTLAPGGARLGWSAIGAVPTMDPEVDTVWVLDDPKSG
jgi:hypothetical protein